MIEEKIVAYLNLRNRFCSNRTIRRQSRIMDFTFFLSIYLWAPTESPSVL